MKIQLRFLFTLLFLTNIYEPNTLSQDQLIEYEGIPMTIYPSRKTDSLLFPVHYDQLKEMGVFGVIASDMFVENYYIDSFKTHNLKVIPQYNGEDSLYGWIYRYTDAYYTIWEAEGTDPENGKVTLFRGDNTVIDSEGNTTFIKTLSTTEPGESIIYGPGYPQNVTYDYDTTKISYTLECRMKIEQRSTPPEGYEDDIVCTLQVTNIDTALSELTVTVKEVRVSEFGGWDNWIVIDTVYNLNGHQNPDNFPAIRSVNQIASCVQFKVIWSGLDYLNLSIDKIAVSDIRGRQLKNPQDPTVRNLIVHQVQSQLTEPAVIGWYGLDEPGSIDNFEPFRVVDSIIKDVSSGSVRLQTLIFGGWNGKFQHWKYPEILSLGAYRDEEFYLRAKQKNIILNLYCYNWPFKSTLSHPNYNSEYRTKNIDWVIDTFLTRFNDIDTGFGISTQGGAYYYLTDGCDTFEEYMIPTPEQISYHVNLGLLYGAREIRLDPFFSDYYDECDGVLHTSGLIDPNNNTTQNYDLFRYTIVPRLNGWFGKTLRGIKQSEQFPNINFSSDYNFINSITFEQDCNIGEQTGEFPYDLGFFEDGTDRKYFMLVRRYYQTDIECEHIIDFDLNTGGGVSQYSNWKLIDYITGATRTKLTSDTIHCEIPAGDAKLFGLTPVIPYGGVVIINDTVKSNTELIGNMTITTGKNIIINDNKIYTIQDTVTLQGTGFITGNGYLEFDGGGWINIVNWSYSLFKGRKDEHPKSIWGKYPGAGTVTNYKVYRRVEGGNWTLIKTLSSSTREYIDSTFEIATTGGNNLDVDYRVTAVLQFFGESGYSNTITYKTDNPLGKGQQLVEETFTYNLEGNYPNPFNPTTSIKYSIAEVADVSLIVYDILGREVKVLVNETKEPGNYEINFNADELSSGVYIYRMTTDKFISTKKMMLMK